MTHCETFPDWQPTLTGELVLLRPTRAEDRKEMFTAASDPQIWAGHPDKDRCTEAGFSNYFDAALASGGALTILDKTVGRIIGCSRYHSYDPAQRRIEIGFTFLVRDCWGGSYNGEVKRLMLEHAFRFVDTVQFAIADVNLRSRKAIEKIGAVLTDAAEDRMTAGKLISYCIYELRRTE